MALSITPRLVMSVVPDIVQTHVRLYDKITSLFASLAPPGPIGHCSFLCATACGGRNRRTDRSTVNSMCITNVILLYTSPGRLTVFSSRNVCRGTIFTERLT